MSTLIPIAGFALAMLGPPALLFAESGPPATDGGTSDASSASDAAASASDSGPKTDANATPPADAGNPCASKILGSVCMATNGDQGTCQSRECRKSLATGDDAGGTTLRVGYCIECVTPDPDDIGPQGSSITGGGCSTSPAGSPFTPFAACAVSFVVALLAFARRAARKT